MVPMIGDASVLASPEAEAMRELVEEFSEAVARCAALVAAVGLREHFLLLAPRELAEGIVPNTSALRAPRFVCALPRVLAETVAAKLGTPDFPRYLARAFALRDCSEGYVLAVAITRNGQPYLGTMMVPVGMNLSAGGSA